MMNVKLKNISTAKFDLSYSVEELYVGCLNIGDIDKIQDALIINVPGTGAVRPPLYFARANGTPAVPEPHPTSLRPATFLKGGPPEETGEGVDRQQLLGGAKTE